MPIKLFACEICEEIYQNEEDARKCEKRHEEADAMDVSELTEEEVA